MSKAKRPAISLGSMLFRATEHWPTGRRILDRWAERILTSQERAGRPLPPQAQEWLNSRRGDRP